MGDSFDLICGIAIGVPFGVLISVCALLVRRKPDFRTLKAKKDQTNG